MYFSKDLAAHGVTLVKNSCYFHMDCLKISYEKLYLSVRPSCYVKFSLLEKTIFSLQWTKTKSVTMTNLGIKEKNTVIELVEPLYTSVDRIRKRA